ncbi:MAG: hypothetical protein SPG61_01215 [Arcanobacterium sp.]|nr:hypothetical protein [Arcanobacterium sp.]
MFSKRSVVSLGVFVAFMLSLFGVAYLKMPALSEEEFLQLSAEQQYEILIENGMEPYSEGDFGVDKDFHLRMIENLISPIIKGEMDANLDPYGSYAPAIIQARIAKTLYEMGYPKVIKPEPPSYYSPEERERYYEQRE